MTEPVSPASITAGALVMQFFLAAIFTGGTVWIGRHASFVERFHQHAPSVGRYAWVLLVYSLLTIGMLVFSDQFTALLRPLTGDFNASLIRWSSALLLVFLADITCCTVLVVGTGGSYQSPFSPVFFILPAMAFFLRETPRRILIYTLLISVAFTFSLVPHDEHQRQEPPTGAYWFVSIACLALSAVIGYLTRPN